jgi:hypothetical protein
VSPKDVWRETDRRERLFGIAEKLGKRHDSKERRRLATAALRKARRA